MNKNLLFSSIVSGLLLGLSWPTYGFVFLIFIGFVPLLHVEHELRDSMEKKRILSIAQERLADHGVIPEQPATYCTLGLAEIEAGSAIGKLLKAK